MPAPVVHFEILGGDGKQLQSFYSDLFSWKIDADNPYEYGLVRNGGEGIDGGIAAGQDNTTRVMVYAQVPDLQATLDRAVGLGGSVIMPPMEIPGAVTMAQFADPAGNVIGIIKG